MSENYTLINWQNGEVTQPAVVEIDGVEYQVQPAIETGNTPMTADNLNHMDNGIRNATLKLNDKIETATVQLIAVTDTAPSECAENDKYYNTNTNLIYTATGTDTWGVTGETPSQLYLYMDISDEKLYYYDGNTFSSYGGGSGDGGKEVFIQSTEPTEETAELWIDTEDDSWNNIGTEVVDTLEGNEGNRAPSVRAVNELNTYSTEEVRIGTWIDGKPLYRKIVTYTPSAIIGEAGKVTDIYIQHGISNFKQLCGQKCITSDGYILPTLGSKSGTTLDYGTCIRAVTTETINLRLVNDSFTIRTWYITLEYTKTTD